MYAMFSQIYRQYFKGAEKADKQEQNVIKTTASHEHASTNKHHKHQQEPVQELLLPTYGVHIVDSHREIIQLQQKNSQLQDIVAQSTARETEFQKVLGDYDELFQKLVDDRKTLVMQNADAKQHLENLETAFYDLLKKYEKAKGIIQSFQDNETILQEELKRYKTLVGDVKRGVSTSNVTASNNNKEVTYVVFDKGNNKEIVRRK